jgi:hypothetical protein
MNPAETKLRSLVSALDLSALEALSSKGLVRRAQKDLDRGLSVGIERENNGVVYIKVDQFDVAIPESGPAKAKCSCPSAGICQHIIAAVLFLQRDDSGSGEPAAITAERELLSFTHEQLESWAGKAAFRLALQLASQSHAELSVEGGLVIRLPTHNAQCHYAPGAGLDGIIVSGKAKDERRVAVAAVIAFQKLKGVIWESPPDTAATLEESAGAPRSRSEVLDIAMQLFGEILDNGLARVSSSTQQRLATLSVSALGVNLPRLSLALHGLSDECALAIARDASSDLGRMLTRMAHAYALCMALQQGGVDSRPDLVGWRRTRYEELGNLDLIGVSAWPWRTASGYTGLTLLFWDTVGKRWNSWTESRPSHQQEGFQPVARYTQPGPWDGAESPRQLSRSSFRLTNTRRNPANRLSGSSKSRALVTGGSNILEHGLPIISDWTQLSEALDSQVAIGLTESNPLDAIFAVKPALWGQRAFDPVGQIFSWLLLDVNGRPLIMEIGFDTFSEPSIRYLETVSVDSVEGAVVIGRVQRNPGRTPSGLSLHSYSIHRKDSVVFHLCLDTVAATNTHQPMAASGEEEEGWEYQEEEERAMAFSPAMNRVFDEVDEILLVVAEAGVAGLNPLRIERLSQIVARTERLGLQGLASGLRNVITRPEASLVLRCCYVSQLHRRAMSHSL